MHLIYLDTFLKQGALILNADLYTRTWTKGRFGALK